MTQSSLSLSMETLRSSAGLTPPKRSKSGFSVLLSCATLLRDWNDQGYTLGEIHDLLQQAGMVISAGTVRGYVVRILKAHAMLTGKLGREPTLPELRAACSARQSAKASPSHPRLGELGQKPSVARPKSVLPFDPDTL